MSDNYYRLRNAIKLMDELNLERARIVQLGEDLKVKLTKIQDNCPHMWEHLTGSGNNDSYDLCEICGVVK